MTNEPLGLPKGSVRAILALIIAAGAIAGFVMAKPEIANKCLDILTGLIFFYFGMKVPTGKEPKGDNE